eukprot:m.79000 g.79000  ORF g.79000 m.79000 type:complete len:436 (-) comp10769_c0_seq1:129-1436(-)
MAIDSAVNTLALAVLCVGTAASAVHTVTMHPKIPHSGVGSGASGTILELGHPRPPYVSSEAYPVFWAVGGNNATDFDPGQIADITQFGILPKNYTFCGRIGGAWPSLPNPTGPAGAVNGGVPQAGNLSLHLDLTRSNVEAMMPDPDYDGLGIYDFEAWVPLWDENTTPASTNWHSQRYQAYSIALVKAAHPDWTPAQLEAQAKQEFETAGMNFFVETLKLCTALRPKALWGFYGMPGGDFALTPATRAKAIADAERMRPVYNLSGALFPSIYLSGTNADNVQRVNTTVGVAVEVAAMMAEAGQRPIPVYPFAWECYHNASTLLTPKDLATDLTQPYFAGADGVIIWGWTGFKPQGGGGANISTYIGHVKTVTGPLVKAFEARVDSCSQTFCSGHGRCATLPDDSNAEESPDCQCFDGYSGPTCSAQARLETVATP